MSVCGEIFYNRVSSPETLQVCSWDKNESQV